MSVTIPVNIVFSGAETAYVSIWANENCNGTSVPIVSANIISGDGSNLGYQGSQTVLVVRANSATTLVVSLDMGNLANGNYVAKISNPSGTCYFCDASTTKATVNCTTPTCIIESTTPSLSCYTATQYLVKFTLVGQPNSFEYQIDNAGSWFPTTNAFEVALTSGSHTITIRRIATPDCKLSIPVNAIINQDCGYIGIFSIDFVYFIGEILGEPQVIWDYTQRPFTMQNAKARYRVYLQDENSFSPSYQQKVALDDNLDEGLAGKKYIPNGSNLSTCHVEGSAFRSAGGISGVEYSRFHFQAFKLFQDFPTQNIFTYSLWAKQEVPFDDERAGYREFKVVFGGIFNNCTYAPSTNLGYGNGGTNGADVVRTGICSNSNINNTEVTSFVPESFARRFYTNRGTITINKSARTVVFTPI